MKENIDTTFEVKIRRNAKTGHVSAEHWLLDGKGESPPGDRPSTLLFDDQGRIRTMIWNKQGETHREAGPAWIDVDPKSGIHLLEQYFENGQCHRGDRKPARISRSPETGEVTQVGYFEHGVEKFWKNKPPVAPGI